CNEKGIRLNNDVNGEIQEGAGWFQYTMKDSKRFSAAKAFLVPALKRKNLTVMTGALCKRIVVEGDRATGIEFMTSRSNTLIARARKEVIVSAGAFESPKLLMLSGIGEKSELKKHGIDVKKELPGVGKNLHDHIFYPVSSLTTIKSNNYYLPWYRQAVALVEFLFTKSGPMSIGPLEAVAFVKSSSEKIRPDIQFQFTPTNAGTDKIANMYDMSSFPSADGYSIFPAQVRPESRGYVALQSADFSAAPIIDPNYLREELDKKIQVAGGRKALEVLEADAFASIRIKTHLPKQ
ncbi:MAG: GMC family oxidoreductase, partial [Cyclobacteriaceae bacterium]